MANVWTELLDLFSDVETSPSQRRELVHIVAPEMHSTIMSGTRALSEFQSRGLGIATSDFYDIWTGTKDAENISSDLFYLPKTSQVTEEMLKVGRSDLTSKYGHLSSYGLLNEETNRVEYKSFFYDSTSLGTRENIESRIREAIGEYYEERFIFYSIGFFI